ncbi:MAG TPA: UDP-glucose/GDP-mannose dehydrogenase family protein [Flavobacteriales bacterium]|nr:UDP-glucose/GDP-mannose dehydrogenase family protein [Flavobacteriales bacterium]
MNIAVVGTGYVGLVTGTCFAETGNHVVCVDINTEKVQMMKDGKVPIYEPHLDVLFERNIRQGRLRFTTDLAEALEKAQIVFLALPTPPGEDGSADLSYVLKAAGDIGRIMKHYMVLVDKSTVPVGTAEKVHAEVAKYAQVEFDVVSNPEFLREGFAVDDFLKPDRVVVGTSSERARKLMEDLYKPFVRQGNPIIFMDERSAELTKYAANAFLAAKITFMNEIANFCEAVGADVDKVRIGMGTDTRIGKRFLFPGIGYGGSCFPKDVQALAKSGKEAGYDFQIINSVMEVNEQQKTALMPKIKAYYGGDLKGRHFAMWGLSFKPDTDDIREAPALYMIDALTKAGATVTAFDPEGANNVKKLIGDRITYAKDEYEALKGADSLIICTEWSLFRTPDFAQLESELKERTIFDGRNLYELDEMKQKGFHYVSIGRNVVTAAHSPKASTKATAKA